jgi:hypothetical protein
MVVPRQVGKIAMTDQQLETQQEGVKLELAGVEAVEKVLDDTFFEIGRDVSELAAAIATSSADLDTARLEMLSRHVALVGAALIDFQNKIGFCATELSERIDKRESMIKVRPLLVLSAVRPSHSRPPPRPLVLTKDCADGDGERRGLAHPGLRPGPCSSTLWYVRGAAPF